MPSIRARTTWVAVSPASLIRALATASPAVNSAAMLKATMLRASGGRKENTATCPLMRPSSQLKSPACLSTKNRV